MDFESFMKREKCMESLYIFLDIDGVLNKKAEWRRPYALNSECIKCFCEFVNVLSQKYIVKVILNNISACKNGC